jgi:hypothetical protein
VPIADRRYTLADIVRTSTDFSATGGALPEPSDDLELDGAGPFDALVAALAEHGAGVYDFRQHARTGRGRARGTRKLANITAILDHQTAVVISNPHTAKGIPTHAVILDNADVVLNHPIRAYLYGAHTANSFTVQIEHSARAAGIEGDRRTFWRSRDEKSRGATYSDLVHEVDDRQLASSWALHWYYYQEIVRQGGTVRRQMTHRESHSSRTSDPGSRIALGVCHPFALATGLEYGGTPVGSGTLVPTVWGGPPGVRYSGSVRGY